MSTNKKLILTSIVTAIASSLCCITPVLALLAGSSGMASTFSWLEPARPYLIGFTVLVLGYVWWQKLKPEKEIDCDCEENEKPSFMQTKLFLAIVTVFAIGMTAFPYFSNVFYLENKKEVLIVDSNSIQKIEITIEGMTCDACQNHVNHAVNELSGIVAVNTSYAEENAIVEFDITQTDVEEIEKAINSTGYEVVKIDKE